MKYSLSLLVVTLISFTSGLVIEIENGKIEGEKGENFYAFKGIPYAEAERFSQATPFLEKWTDVKDFKEFGPICAQYDHLSYDFTGDENCLTLNVFVPQAVSESSEPAPVIFYIHGGAFMFGGSNFYGPENVMDHGKMILVTINYRLGILGFLSTEDEVLPGNLGLKDQVEALKWVQRNIRAFNGDPDKVTTVGYSAGGASVHLHYMSKLSKGLFNNGVSHSGVASNAWVLMEKAREKAHKVGALAGCEFGEDHKNLIKCLKEKPVEELTVIAKHFQPFLYNPFSPFGVAIEPDHENAFITEHPYDILESGNYNKQPWLVSQTKDEGSYPSAEFYKDEETLQEIDDRWEELAPYILDFYGLTNDDKLGKTISGVIRNFYLKDREISRENFQIFNDIITDRLFKSDAKKALGIQSKLSPSFMYYFNFKSLSGLGEYIANTTDDFGIAHGEDVLLMFPSDLRSIPYSDDEKLMINNLIGIWHSFATENVPSFGDFKIEQSMPNKIQGLKITSNEDFKMVELNQEFGEVEFWEGIEKKLMNQQKFNDEL